MGWIKKLWQRLFGEREVWEYGKAGQVGRRARRHKKNGRVQFVMWKAGEHGHTEDWWIDFHYFWWPTFQADPK